MIVILTDSTKTRSQYLYEELKEKYKQGKVYNLASIDKVKEVANMLKWTKNYGIADEINKLWKSYNSHIASQISDYIEHYKRPEDIVLVTVTDEEGASLLLDYLNEHNHSSIYYDFIGGAPKNYTNKLVSDIISKKQNDIPDNKEEGTV